MAGRRALETTLAVVLLLTLGYLLSPSLAPTAAAQPAAISPVPALIPTGEGMLVAQATQTLATGAGPAHGAGVSCTMTSAGSGRCSSPIRTDPRATELHPSLTTGTLQWFNQTGPIQTATTSLSGATVPSVAGASAIAYDPLLKEVVLWVGCSQTQCPAGDTWAYNGLGWRNLTSSLTPAPSARMGAGLDYDPLLQSLVLVGGFNETGFALAETWEFNGAWMNITTNVGPVYALGMAYGSLAWDPAPGAGLVWVDGCFVQGCGGLIEATFVLNTSWSSPTDGPDGVSASYTNGSMVWDPVDNYLVWFGGNLDGGGTINNTVTWTPGGGWVDISTNDGGCTHGLCRWTPPGRAGAAMTWDAAVGAAILTGGYNSTGPVYYNDTWEFVGGKWYPMQYSSTLPPATFLPVAYMAVPENSTDVSPLFVGGISSASAGVSTNEWVCEYPPSPYLSSVTPNPTDLGSTVHAVATFHAPAGSGPSMLWNIAWGDSTSNSSRVSSPTSASYNVPASHVYTTSGAFPTTVSATDFLWVTNSNASGSVTVHPALAVTASFSPSSPVVNGTVAFSSLPSGGSGTYTYAWSFGDGSAISAAQNPAHAYVTARTYTVTLWVNDSLSGLIKTLSVSVGSPGSGSSGSGLFSGSGALWIALVVVVLVVVIVLVLLLRRRKGGSATVPPPAAMGQAPPGVTGGVPPPPPPTSPG